MAEHRGGLGLRVRRLRDAARRRLGGRGGSAALGTAGRRARRAVAAQAARVFLAALADGPARRLLAGDAGRAGFRARRACPARGRAAPAPAGRLSGAGGLPGRGPDLAGTARRRLADRDPVQRQPRHAARGGRGGGHRRPSGRRAVGRRGRRVQAGPGGLSSGDRSVRRAAARRSPFSPAMAGTCMVPPRSAFAASGSIAPASRTTACPACRCR